MAAYDASKAALNSLTRTFAKKLAPRIRVNAVAPGYVDSKWNEDSSEEDRKRLGEEQLTGKLIVPQQVADLVMHIIQNSGLDGEVIYLDGGQTLRTI
jgi:3-oxoacyl-[acyl-carrier protein] reductase